MSDPSRNNPSRDPSIEHEPHLSGGCVQSDPSEAFAEQTLHAESASQSEANQVEHTVWDEPALSPQLAGETPEDELTYARWLEQGIASTSLGKSWATTLWVAMVAGPFGLLGAIGAGQQNAIALAILVIVGPVTEEVMKIAAALWVVEKRPFLFKSGVQILICAAAGGIVFATIENLIYLYVYVPNHSLGFAAWRWSVCVGLHVNCSFVAGVGMVRIWDNAIRERRRPELALGVPFFVTAMVGHGLYNAGVLVAESAGWLEF